MSALVRYIAVQLLAYGLDVGTFTAIVTLVDLAAPLANVFAKIVAGIFAFFAHRHVTFEAAEHGRLWDQMARYATLLLLNGFASSALLATLLLVIPHPLVAKILADVALITVSFSLSKALIFRRHRTEAGENER